MLSENQEQITEFCECGPRSVTGTVEHTAHRTTFAEFLFQVGHFFIFALHSRLIKFSLLWKIKKFTFYSHEDNKCQQILSSYLPSCGVLFSELCQWHLLFMGDVGCLENPVRGAGDCPPELLVMNPSCVSDPMTLCSMDLTSVLCCDTDRLTTHSRQNAKCSALNPFPRPCC